MNNEWISVTDRLPEVSNVYSEKVLVIEQGEIYIAVYIKTEDYEHWLLNEKGGNLQVTHWMPIPEPPKQ